jgi:Kef-type K+ transport system membrane component KefB
VTDLPAMVISTALPGAQGAAAAAQSDVLASLEALVLIFIAAKAGEEVLRRLGQPAAVGELIGGFLVGPYALALVTPDATAAVFAEIGIVILLFSVGLEVRTDDLLAVGRPAVLVAVLGIILPVLACAGFALAAGYEVGTSVFVGLTFAATSIGITSRVLADMGVLSRAFARVILGAAVVDDILVLILIGVVSGLVQGNLSGSTLLLAVAGVGLVLLALAVARRARGLRREAFTWPLFADTPLVPGFIIMLLAALVAARFGLAAIIGAFLAGLVIAETEARDELERDMRPLASIFTPFFFGVIGASLDLGVLLAPATAAFVLGLAVLAVATKVLAGMLGARGLGSRPALAVGIGMVPRGEVGIVVATLGAGFGLFSTSQFSALLGAVVVTTLAAPILLGWAIRRLPRFDGRPSAV